MTTHTSFPIRRLALLAALPLMGTLLSACGGGGGGGDEARAYSGKVTEAVPASVATDPNAAAVYTRELAATLPAESDELEPVAVPEQLAVDDTAEPVS
jgi:hypothetical protein